MLMLLHYWHAELLRPLYDGSKTPLLPLPSNPLSCNGRQSTMRARPSHLFQLLLAAVSLAAARSGQRLAPADVVVYGGTPAGCAAALAAALSPGNLSVALLAPSPYRVGGMTSGGLGHTDVGDPRVIGGLTREFYQRVSAYYTGVRNTSQCYNVESHVAEKVYTAWLAEAGVHVRLASRLVAAGASGTAVTHVELSDGLVQTGRVFVDASYEGDLMAAAGVRFVVGREGRARFGEESSGRMAPNFVLSRYQFQFPVNHTDASGSLLPLVERGPVAPVGAADSKVQAYCFRPCMSKLAGGKAVPVPPPQEYDAAEWQLLRNLLAAHPSPNELRADDFLFFAGPLGNSTGAAAKFDVGTTGPINLDYIGASWEYPNANATRREAIVTAHVRYTLGLLHFLSNDPSVPAPLRDDVRLWGLCADEFVRENHFPRSSLYVREARRMVGTTILTEHDRVTNLTKPDTVGLGSYNCDVHMAEIIPVVNNGTPWVMSEGWLTHDFPHIPFELPYSMMLPEDGQAGNLLVPVATSSSHVAFGALRLEPTWSILGHAAGAAAAMAAVATPSPARPVVYPSVRDVNVTNLQRLLRLHGQLLTAAELPPHQPVVQCRSYS